MNRSTVRVKIENISIQKWVDLASPLLLLFGAQGKHITDGTLTTRKASKGGSTSAPIMSLAVMRMVPAMSLSPPEAARIMALDAADIACA